MTTIESENCERNKIKLNDKPSKNEVKDLINKKKQKKNRRKKENNNNNKKAEKDKHNIDSRAPIDCAHSCRHRRRRRCGQYERAPLISRTCLLHSMIVASFVLSACFSVCLFVLTFSAALLLLCCMQVLWQQSFEFFGSKNNSNKIE